MAAALRELREYVTAGDASRYDSLPEGFVRIDVTHSNLTQRWHDVLVYLDSPIADLKQKLFKKNGTMTDSMELFVRGGTHGPSVFMGDDTKTFRYYGGRNGCEVHIRDTDPYSISAHGALENLALVEKYIMPDDVYDKLPNTLRSHIRKEREANPDFKLKVSSGGATSERPRAPLPSENPSTPTNASEIFVPGTRCEVNPGGRRGTIKYIGQMGGMPGTWIGIDLDEPLGHNDGTGPDGIGYFECKGESYGCFAKHYNVNVGDFPELDPFASSDDEI